MANYPLIFSITLVVNVVVTFRSSDLYSKYKHWFSTSSSPTTSSSSDAPEETFSIAEKSKHKQLLIRYLTVYLLATLSDWLQGPYVYALYDAYGYSQHDIAVLFVAGFGSSMIFGSFVGGMADTGGRRTFVVLFAIIYAASCMTKHVKEFNVLLLGRLLGGIATSLLFSVFDSWLIRAHSIAKIDKALLSQSFSYASYGNSIIAIVAGLLANKVANSTSLSPFSTESDTALVYYGGFIAPFDVAFIALILCGSLSLFLWEENYGEAELVVQDDTSNPHTTESDSFYSRLTCMSTMKKAYVTTMRNRNILLCGIISSLFEGSMYVFVFMWTPSLTSVSPERTELPFGLIFSTFMVCCMAGSSLFSIMITKYRAERLSIVVFFISSIAFLVITLTKNDTVTFAAMNLFEMCVGMYFPSMGTMKSSIVPETQRSAIYNLYRIPLNFIVLTSLLTNLTPQVSFALCCGMLMTACVLQINLTKRREMECPDGSRNVEMADAPPSTSENKDDTVNLLSQDALTTDKKDDDSTEAAKSMV